MAPFASSKYCNMVMIHEHSFTSLKKPNMCISSISVSGGTEKEQRGVREKREEGGSLEDGKAGKGLALRGDRE